MRHIGSWFGVLTLGLILSSGAYALVNSGSGVQGFNDTSSFCIGGGCLNISTPGLNNSAYGNGALFSITTGTQNTAVGYNAGYLITTGSYNTMFGSTSCSSHLTTGSDNVCIGYVDTATATTLGGIAIGDSVIAGSSDTAIGHSALTATTTDGQKNTAYGAFAMQGTTTGTNNVAVGWSALNSNTQGSGNVAFGYSAGLNAGFNSDGNNNVFVGNNAGLKVLGSTNVVIGYNVASSAFSTGSNNILIGNSSAIAATTSVTANEIHIGGTGGDWSKVTGTDTQATQATTIYGTLALPNIAADTAHTDSSVCQDTTTHIFYAGTGTLGICLGTSSARYKRDISFLPQGLIEINNLKPVSFYYKKGHGDNGIKKQYGLIAEDTYKVLPDLVAFDNNGKPNTVDLLGMVPVMVHAMQEQDKKLNDKFKEAVARIDALEHTVKQLKGHK